jgi:hypothetical protein
MATASSEKSRFAIPSGRTSQQTERVRSIVRLGFRLLVTLSLVLLAFLIFVMDGIHRPVLFRLPPNYQGWVAIEYERPDCPPLKTEGLFVVIPIGASGDGCTSSPSPFTGGLRYTQYQSVGAGGAVTVIHATGWGRGGRIWAGSFAFKQTLIPYPIEQFFVGTESELKNSWKDEPKPWVYEKR